MIEKEIQELLERRNKQHSVTGTVTRVFYRTIKGRIYVFLYKILGDTYEIEFNGMCWKKVDDNDFVPCKSHIFASAKERFTKHPIKIPFWNISEGDIPTTRAVLNFYQYRRIETFLPKIWLAMLWKKNKYHLYQAEHINILYNIYKNPTPTESDIRLTKEQAIRNVLITFCKQNNIPKNYIK